MAATGSEPEESLWETHVTSLLEVIEDRQKEQKNVIHRLVYIGKLSENVDDRNAVGNHYDYLFKNLQNAFQTEPITGLLLVYLKHIVHVVEASSDMITELIRDIVDTQRTSKGFLEQAKILVISHNIEKRLYQQWNFRTLDILAAKMEAYETSEGVEQMIIDMLTQLLKLGSKISIIPMVLEDGSSFIRGEDLVASKQTLDSLHEKFPDLLPQQAHIHYLMEENDMAMMLPDEYLSMYDTPFDETLESLKTWPLPTKLFPYT